MTMAFLPWGLSTGIRNARGVPGVCNSTVLRAALAIEDHHAAVTLSLTPGYFRMASSEVRNPSQPRKRWGPYAAGLWWSLYRHAIFAVPQTIHEARC